MLMKIYIAKVVLDKQEREREDCFFFCNFTGTNEEVYNDYFQREESTNNDAVKRNEIREKLLSMFQSIQVRLF